jgi:cellulose synthase/poly-beta-1,6-N-acetylglucosamine synthase-like glycosyltransferase
MRVATIVLFWLSLAAVAYAYAAYPAVLWVLARCFGRRREAAVVEGGALPEVSLLIAAHDEEAVIAERVRNALAMDYPRHKLEVVIASDGSSDGTAAVVRRFAEQGVRLLDFRERRGKATVLNDAMSQVRGEIVLLSDANTFTEPGAARSLVSWFVDERVGAVCGRLVLTDPQSGKNADGLYWKYETFLKRQEGRLGALLGSNGAIYAIRRELFRPIPPNTIVDDFVIPLLAKLRHGCEIVYDSAAVAHEESAPDLKAEFRRRSRIGVGGWQAIGMLWRLLDPRRGWVAFTFFSHKVLRWLCPMFLTVALAANAALWRQQPYRGLLLLHVVFYVAAVVGMYVPGRLPFARVLRLAGMFVSMNAALFVGFCRWLGGVKGGTWSRTRRSNEGDGSVAAAPSGT